MASLKKIVRQATRSVQRVAAPVLAKVATGGIAEGALAAVTALAAGKERAPVAEEILPPVTPTIQTSAPPPPTPQIAPTPQAEKSDRTSPADPVVIDRGPAEPFPLMPLVLAGAGLIAVAFLTSRKG